MSSETYASGVFFNNQVASAKAMRSFAANSVGDGILQGCGLTWSSTTVIIAPGVYSVGGGLTRVESATTLTFDDSSKTYHRIIAKVDTSKTATTASFQQSFFFTEDSNTDSGWRTLTTEDINVGTGTVYEIEFAVGTASGTVRTKTAAGSSGISLDLLWANASPTTEISGTVLTYGSSGLLLRDPTEYDGIFVSCVLDNRSSSWGNTINNHKGFIFLFGDDTNVSSFAASFDMALTEWYCYFRQRAFYTNLSSNDWTVTYQSGGTQVVPAKSIFFTPAYGTYDGSASRSSTNGNMLIPEFIFGIKGVPQS